MASLVTEESYRRLMRENVRLTTQLGTCERTKENLKRQRRQLRAEVRELRRTPWVLLPWKGYVS